MTPPLLQVDDLRVAFRLPDADGRAHRVEAVGRGAQGVSFEVPAHATVALVGESGSGKSVAAMALAGLLPRNAECAGRVLWDGEDLLRASPARLRRLRGREIACVFQDPMSALNPVRTVGAQIAEPLRRHLALGRAAARRRAEDLLAEVGIAEPRRRLDAFPHQLSGGQQQRVLIAMALACEPRLLVADEPTTALDPTTQRQVLALLARLQAQRGLSLLVISHDLDLVGEIAQQIVVMRQGTVREAGAARTLFDAPADAYTRALLACRPRLDRRVHRLAVVDEVLAAGPGPATPPAPVEAPTPRRADDAAPVVLQAEGLSQGFWLRRGVFGRAEFTALRDVGFTLRRGHTLGVVGESGSGKTTLALALLGLHDASAGPAAGRVLLHGHDLLRLAPAPRRALRRRLQIVFQNPADTLNPHHTIGRALVEPMALHRIGADAAARRQRAREWLRRVGLDADAMHGHPHEFSGGQRQRIAIARGLALSPDVLVLDEAVAALDVSVQAQVLNLLKDLQDELGLAYVFISHDLAAVRFMADDVLVMQDGRVVEHQPAQALLAHPQAAPTRRLIAASARGAAAAPPTGPPP